MIDNSIPIVDNQNKFFWDNRIILIGKSVYLLVKVSLSSENKQDIIFGMRIAN